MRVIISGGGTAGHVNPALAIGDIILKEEPKAEILYVGSKLGIENELVKKHGFKYTFTSVDRIRKGFLQRINSYYKLIKSFFEARKILDQFKPDLVIGTGGYVASTILLAAALKKIPTIVHEQNAVPSRTNRILSKYVDKVLLSIPTSNLYFDSSVQDKLIFTGMPLVGNFNISKVPAKNSEIIRIATSLGSNGSEKINQYLVDISRKISNAQITHTTGKIYFEEYSIMDLPECITLRAYDYDMKKTLAENDIIIARAGSSTIFELISSRTPSIIIPSPNVKDDHQRKNVEFLKNSGAVVILDEEGLTPEILLNEIEKLRPAKERDKLIECMEKLDIADVNSKIRMAIFE